MRIDNQDPIIIPQIPGYPGDQANEIISFPGSVQSRLDEASRLLERGNPEAALSAVQQAGIELARSSPEFFIFALACQMGAQSIALERTTMDVETEQTDRYAFGIRYGRDVKTTNKSRVERRTFKAQ